MPQHHTENGHRLGGIQCCYALRATRHFMKAFLFHGGKDNESWRNGKRKRVEIVWGEVERTDEYSIFI